MVYIGTSKHIKMLVADYLLIDYNLHSNELPLNLTGVYEDILDNSSQLLF